MTEYITAKPGWLPGDCVRVSNKRKALEMHKPPADVTTTYDHVYLHDPFWSETHCNSESNLPYAYVSVFREKLYVIENRTYWSDKSERVRLVKKPDAAVSFVISGVDDFWIEDRGDPFVILTNLRSGKKLIRFLLHKEWLPEVSSKLGLKLLH